MITLGRVNLDHPYLNNPRKVSKIEGDHNTCTSILILGNSLYNMVIRFRFFQN